MKELVNKIKDLWNIYGGIALSTLIAWLSNWNRDSIDKWSSYILLCITCISLLTFLKVVLFKKKPNNIADNIALNQTRNVRVIKTALNPESVGEELGNAIIYTINGGKKMKEKLSAFFKLIYGNKFTSLSLLLNLAYTGLAQFLLYSDTLADIPFFVEHKVACIVVATTISVLWLALELYKDIKNYGFENLDKLNEKWAERKAKKEAKLTKEQKETIKNQIEELQNKQVKLSAYINDIKESMEKYKAIINKVNDYKALGIMIESSLLDSYNTACVNLSRNKSDLDRLTASKDEVENQIKELNEKLNK